jgi:AraC-like DNA-binding protein
MHDPLEDPIVAKRINYHARLAKLARHMNQHSFDQVSLQSAAEIVCMEKTSFSRFFRRTVGITFQEFVQRRRITRAVEQMPKADHSLTHIAELAGFSSIASFERAFRKYCGCTPSEYRKRLLVKSGLASNGKHYYEQCQEMTRNGQRHKKKEQEYDSVTHVVSE